MMTTMLARVRAGGKQPGGVLKEGQVNRIDRLAVEFQHEGHLPSDIFKAIDARAADCLQALDRVVGKRIKRGIDDQAAVWRIVRRIEGRFRRLLK